MKRLKSTDKIGKKYITNEGYEIEVLEYFDYTNCTIQFNCGLVLKNRGYKAVIRGKVKYPYCRSVFGVGFLGVGEYKTRSAKKVMCRYMCWSQMIRRGYSEKIKERYPTYKDCSVDEHWHNYQNFAKWYEENYNPETMQGWHLDKDILIKGNKIYSAETCCFVPHGINSLLLNCNLSKSSFSIVNGEFLVMLKKFNKAFRIGLYSTQKEAFQAYKSSKESHIKEVANIWKDKITDQVYQALINYEVDITNLSKI